MPARGAITCGIGISAGSARAAAGNEAQASNNALNLNQPITAISLFSFTRDARGQPDCRVEG